MFFCRRLGQDQYEEVGGANLMSELKASPYRQLLVYVHGFSNLPEAVFEGAAEFQALCDKSKKHEVLVLPVVWPCDDDFGIVKDYWDDQNAADSIAFSLARVLSKFLEWREDANRNPAHDPCLKRINMLAHSMGNRVLRETLWAWRKYDLPLRSSKVANLKNKIASRRLGHTGPENIDLTPANVYAVDCDDVNTAYDNPKGHSYFRSGKKKGEPGKVFAHIWQTLMTGRVFPEDEARRTSIIRVP